MMCWKLLVGWWMMNLWLCLWNGMRWSWNCILLRFLVLFWLRRTISLVRAMIFWWIRFLIRLVWRVLESGWGSKLWNCLLLCWWLWVFLMFDVCLDWRMNVLTSRRFTLSSVWYSSALWVRWIKSNLLMMCDMFCMFLRWFFMFKVWIWFVLSLMSKVGIWILVKWCVFGRAVVLFASVFWIVLRTFTIEILSFCFFLLMSSLLRKWLNVKFCGVVLLLLLLMLVFLCCLWAVFSRILIFIVARVRR